jgi:hypothetical protein
MARRRRHLGTDPETLAALVAVLTPLARRLATDRELRDELRTAAESVTGAYRKARSGYRPAQASHHDRTVHAYEESASDGGFERVDAEIVGDERLHEARRGRALVGVGLAAGALGTAAALLGSKRTGPRVKRALGRIVSEGRGPRGAGL